MSRDRDIDIGAGGIARPGKRKKHLKVYHTLYESNYRDVPKSLRKLARSIEDGEYGDVNEAALVMLSEKQGMTVHGFGPQSTGANAHLALTMGATYIHNIFYSHRVRE